MFGLLNPSDGPTEARSFLVRRSRLLDRRTEESSKSAKPSTKRAKSSDFTTVGTNLTCV